MDQIPSTTELYETLPTKFVINTENFEENSSDGVWTSVQRMIFNQQLETGEEARGFICDLASLLYEIGIIIKSVPMTTAPFKVIIMYTFQF